MRVLSLCALCEGVQGSAVGEWQWQGKEGPFSFTPTPHSQPGENMVSWKFEFSSSLELKSTLLVHFHY